MAYQDHIDASEFYIGLGESGPFSISAFADEGGGFTRVTAAGHDLVNGARVSIYGTTNYSASNWDVSGVAGDTFLINTAFVANDATGTVSSVAINDGTLSNNASPRGVLSRVSGVFGGNGYRFLGNASSNNYLELFGLTGSAFSTFYKTFWYQSGTGVFQQIFGAEGAGSDRFSLEKNASDQLTFFFRGADSGTLNFAVTNHTPANALANGSWNHCVLQCTGADMELWINGVEETLSYGSQVSGGTYTFAINPYLGAKNNNGTPAVGAGDKNIDEFFFARGATLSPSEIAELFAGPATPPTGSATITSPADTATGVQRPNASIAWSDTAAGHTGFHVQVALDAGFTELLIDETTGASPFDTGVNLLNATHYARVAPTNGGGDGTWSPVISFTTDSAGLSLAYPLGRGVAAVAFAAMGIPDGIYFRAMPAAQWLGYLTCPGFFLFTFSRDHKTPSAMHWGYMNNADGSDAVYGGVMFDDTDLPGGWESAETPQLILDLDYPARPVRLYYHAKNTAVAEQNTRLASSAGGDLLHNLTWTDEGTALPLSGAAKHSGYAHAIKVATGSYKVWSRFSDTQFEGALWKSTDGIDFGATPFATILKETGYGSYAFGHAGPHWVGMFKYAGRWFYPHAVLNRWGIMEVDDDGISVGRFHVLDWTQRPVGNEGPDSPQFEGAIYNSDGTYWVDPEGFIHLYISQNSPNNSNALVMYATIDLKQLASSHAAGNGSTAKDVTGLAPGEYEVRGISRRSDGGGDIYDSVDVTIT